MIPGKSDPAYSRKILRLKKKREKKPLNIFLEFSKNFQETVENYFQKKKKNYFQENFFLKKLFNKPSQRHHSNPPEKQGLYSYYLLLSSVNMKMQPGHDKVKSDKKKYKCLILTTLYGREKKKRRDRGKKIPRKQSAPRHHLRYI